jgi:[ribosomal protein S5]-alanine N-acetyltransferase
MNIHIETARLIIREVREIDENGFFELDSDPEVHTYLGNQPIKNLEEARAVIQFIRQQYIDNGIGRWAILDKTNNEFVGWIGLKLVKDEINKHSNFYDLGYRLQKKHWGKGFASEAAEAVLDYAFNNMKLTEVNAFTDVENQGSCNVLKKAGFKFVETFDYYGVPHGWFCLKK